MHISACLDIVALHRRLQVVGRDFGRLWQRGERLQHAWVLACQSLPPQLLIRIPRH